MVTFSELKWWASSSMWGRAVRLWSRPRKWERESSDCKEEERNTQGEV